MVGLGRIQPAHINTSLLRSIYAPSSYYSKLWLLFSYTKVRCWYGCSWPCILPGSIVFVLVGNVGGYTKNVRVSEAISAMLHSEPPLRLRLASPICILRSVLCSSDALQHPVVSCWAQKLAGDMDTSLIHLFVVEFMRRHPPLRACRRRRWRCPHRLLFS